MSSAEFTPGPWMSQFDEDHHAWIVRIPSDGTAIAGVIESGFEAQDEANAHLIAAAPELFQALEIVRDADEDCKRDGLPAIPALVRKQIDAALALARGESS